MVQSRGQSGDTISITLARPGDLGGIVSEEMEPILQLRYNQINAENNIITAIVQTTDIEKKTRIILVDWNCCSGCDTCSEPTGPGWANK